METPVELTIQIHDDDVPSLDAFIDELRLKRKKKEALEADYERQRAEKAKRAEAEHQTKLKRREEKRKLAEENARHKSYLKELSRRADMDVKMGKNTLDEFIDGEPNPDYMPVAGAHLKVE